MKERSDETAGRHPLVMKWAIAGLNGKRARCRLVPLIRGRIETDAQPEDRR